MPLGDQYTYYADCVLGLERKTAPRLLIAAEKLCNWALHCFKRWIPKIVETECLKFAVPSYGSVRERPFRYLDQTKPALTGSRRSATETMARTASPRHIDILLLNNIPIVPLLVT